MSKAIESQVGDWYPLLGPIVSSDKFKPIMSEIKRCKQTFTKIYPETTKTFRAFKLCQLADTRVVILGQDPYHDGSATGLAFANTNEGSKVSPSLKWIVKALEYEYNTVCVDFDYDLESWASQGVLLLNTALTVVKGYAGSHTELWRPFTEDLITSLSLHKNNIIFVLWGKKAQEYARFIKGDNKIITAPHPAADAYTGGRAGFHTAGSFSAVNSFLDDSITWNTYCGEPLPREINEAPF